MCASMLNSIVKQLIMIAVIQAIIVTSLAADIVKLVGPSVIETLQTVAGVILK
jgi:hypothetical protein